MSALTRHRRGAALLAGTVLMVGGLVAFTNGAASADAEELPGSLVEDFSYPNGTEDPGITLTKGDGNLLRVDCVPGETQIKAVALDDRGVTHNYCFELRGDHGFVEMVLVGAWQVWADETHPVTAEYTVEGDTETKTIPPNELEGIGFGEGRDAATLLELRV